MAEAFYIFDEDDASSSAEDSECEEVKLVEELVQDDVESEHETILVSRKVKTLQASMATSSGTDEVHEAGEAQRHYYCQTFLLSIATLKQEQLIRRSPRSKRIAITLVNLQLSMSIPSFGLN